MTILICTSSNLPDASIGAVTKHLERLNQRVVRLETDRFPTEVQLSYELSPHEKMWLTTKDTVLDMQEVSAIWVRDISAGERLPDDMEGSVRSASQEESQTALWGLLGCVDAFQLDPIGAVQRAPTKPAQLRLAAQLGLDIPRSLFSNDPAAVRAFAKTCNSGVVTKMIHGATVTQEDGSQSPIYTNLLSAEDLNDLDGLSLCPMIFQEKIIKKLELRLTVVGHKIFAASIDPTQSALGENDWRQDPALVRSFVPYHGLPREIEQKLFEMLNRCGLNFATVDIIVTPDDRFVFLEFNSCISYFDFIERATEMPIAAEVAGLLAGHITPRIPHTRG